MCRPPSRRSTTAGPATSSSPRAGTSSTPTACSPRSATPARYIGLLGSRRKTILIDEMLREHGVAEDRIRAIHAPVGLDLGGRTPAEIALSVMAEITQIRYQGTGSGAETDSGRRLGPGSLSYRAVQNLGPNPVTSEPRQPRNSVNVRRTMFTDLRFGARLLLKDRSFALTALLDAGGVHRRQCGDLQRRPLGAAEAAAGAAIRRPGPHVQLLSERGRAARVDGRARLLRPAARDDGLRRAGAVSPARASRWRGGRRRSAAGRARHAVVLPDRRRARRCAAGSSARTKARKARTRVVMLSHAIVAAQRFGGNPSSRRPDHAAERPAVQDRRRDAAGLQVSLERHRSLGPGAFTAQEKSDESRHSNNWTMIGRLKPGATLDAGAAAARCAQRAERRALSAVPADSQGRRLRTASPSCLQDEIVGDVRPVLYLLWGGVRSCC